MQGAQDAMLLNDAPRPVGEDRPDHDGNRGAAECAKPTHDTVELIVESEAKANDDHVIEEAAETIEDEERRERHPEGTRHGSRKEGQPWDKFRHNQGLPAEPLKGGF